jgi:hypothetical protein
MSSVSWPNAGCYIFARVILPRPNKYSDKRMQMWNENILGSIFKSASTPRKKGRGLYTRRRERRATSLYFWCLFPSLDAFLVGTRIVSRGTYANPSRARARAHQAGLSRCSTILWQRILQSALSHVKHSKAHSFSTRFLYLGYLLRSRLPFALRYLRSNQQTRGSIAQTRDGIWAWRSLAFVSSNLNGRGSPLWVPPPNCLLPPTLSSTQFLPPISSCQSPPAPTWGVDGSYIFTWSLLGMYCGLG